VTLLGALLAAGVGLTLGLFGGGGGILTVPVLTYVLGVPAKAAVVVSNLVIGIAAAVSVAARWHRGEVRVAAAAAFLATSLVAAFAAARLAPRVPTTVQLALLAGVMLASAAAMLRSAARPDGARADSATPPHPHRARTATVGALTGALTGLTGIGGGVVIVPALVALLGFPLAQASATSLAIIAVNSAAALAGGLGGTAIPWAVALPFTALVIAAALGGGRLARHVPVATLKRGFAALLVAVAGVIVYRELLA
jgi:hypothetical protein